MQIIFRTAPVYFWYFSIWCISKIFQYIFNQEKTVWELIWQRSLIFFSTYAWILHNINLTFLGGGGLELCDRRRGLKI